eukprot:453357-Amphidinium_carterae.1
MEEGIADSQRQLVEMQKDRSRAEERNADMMLQMQQSHRDAMTQAMRSGSQSGGGWMCCVQ